MLLFEASGETIEAYKWACFDQGFSLQMELREPADQWLGPEIIGVVSNMLGVAEFIAAIVNIVVFVPKVPTRQEYIKITRRDGTKIELTAVSPGAVAKLLSDA
jgi:hypothetical protein